MRFGRTTVIRTNDNIQLSRNTSWPTVTSSVRPTMTGLMARVWKMRCASSGTRSTWPPPLEKSSTIPVILESAAARCTCASIDCVDVPPLDASNESPRCTMTPRTGTIATNPRSRRMVDGGDRAVRISLNLRRRARTHGPREMDRHIPPWLHLAHSGQEVFAVINPQNACAWDPDGARTNYARKVVPRTAKVVPSMHLALLWAPVCHGFTRHHTCARSGLPMAAESDPDFSRKLRCPTCGATEARTAIRSLRVAFVRCAACGMMWSVLDRRGRYPSPHPPAVLSREQRRRKPMQAADSDSPEVLWRVGVFACELRAVADMAFPAVLCVFKDGDPVLELPVLSALEAEERAHGLRILVERHQLE